MKPGTRVRILGTQRDGVVTGTSPYGYVRVVLDGDGQIHERRFLPSDVITLRPDHRYDGAVPGATGYAPTCICGWVGKEYRNRRAAQGAGAAHVKYAS